MNEAEARALNMTGQAWRERIAKQVKKATDKSPDESAHYDPGMTIEDLLGKNVCDAVLDDVIG